MLKTRWKLLKTALSFHKRNALGWKRLPHRGAVSIRFLVSDIKDLAVVLDLFAGSQNVHHGIVGVCTLSKLDLHLLGHKADGSLCHACNGAQFAQSTSIL